MTANNIKELACATLMQAARDYFCCNENNKKVILKDLRSPWMDLFTDGLSVVVAEQLELRPEDIAARLR